MTLFRAAFCLLLSACWVFPAYSAGASCSPPHGDLNGNYMIPGVLGNVAYADGPGSLSLDAYAPAGEPRPAAVIIHGSRGDKRTHVTQLFDVLTNAGYAWFSVDYRTAEDVSKALSYIQCPGRFNIRGDLVLIGTGMGAAVALELASRGRVRSVVILGGKFPISNFQFPGPVLMFQGTKDEEYPFAKAESLCKQLPHCAFHAVPDAIHDFENWHPDQWAWKEDLTAWLRQDRRGLWKDIAYARPGGRPLLMDAYVPSGPGPFPAVIIAHGGGWEAGDKVTYISPILEPLARAGFAWFSIDYRLTPYVHVPEQLDDIRSAVRYVRAHADRFHVDPSQIALLGESASGHLVAQVGSVPCPGCEVQAIVSFYGIYNFLPWAERAGEQRDGLKRLFADVSPEALKRYSPITYARAGMPPILLIQGTGDELDKGTEEYAARLKEVGARYELVLLKGAPHGMENWQGHPEWMFYKQRLVDWLSTTLAASPSKASPARSEVHAPAESTGTGGGAAGETP